ncbi:extracellular solute-binding protein [Streptomyces sp. M19]
MPGVDKAVDLWNRQHPEVRVELEKVSAVDGAQYAKMHAAVEAGNPPDLGQIEYPVVPSFLLDNGLLDLTKYQVGRYKDRFVGWQWQQSVFGKGVYAIPQASGPMALFLRRDLFDKWAIEPPATWDDYEAAAKAVRKRAPGSRPSPPPTATASRPSPGRPGPAGSAPTATPGPCTSTTSPPARSPTTGTAWSGGSSSRPSPTGRAPGTRTSRPAT